HRPQPDDLIGCRRRGPDPGLVPDRPPRTLDRSRSRPGRRGRRLTSRLPEVELFDLTGHVSIVTGGNRGIGFGLARGLARANASVAIWARDLEKADEAVGRLSGLGKGEAISVACDVTDERSVIDALA